jgi:hypothetical protein
LRRTNLRCSRGSCTRRSRCGPWRPTQTAANARPTWPIRPRIWPTSPRDPCTRLVLRKLVRALNTRGGPGLSFSGSARAWKIY